MAKNYRLFRILIIWIYAFVAAVFFALSLFFLLESNGSLFGVENFLLRLQDKIYYLFWSNSLFAIAIVLIVLVTIPQLTSSFLTIARMKRGIMFAFLSAVILLVLSIHLCIWFSSDWISYFCLFVSIFEMVLSILCWIAFYQYHFYFDENSYYNLGFNREALVVYYAYNDYVRKHAYEIANMLESDLFEIKLKKERSMFGVYYDTFKEKEVELLIDNINMNRYKSVHIIYQMPFNKIISPTLTFIRHNQFKNKKIYVEVVGVKTKNYNLVKKAANKELKHIQGYFFTTMRFGVVTKRIRK